MVLFDYIHIRSDLNNDRQSSSSSDGVAEIVKAASTASKEVQERTREELVEIKNKLAHDSEKLKEEFELKAGKERAILEKRLEGRHQKRLGELMDQVRIVATRLLVL